MVQSFTLDGRAGRAMDVWNQRVPRKRRTQAKPLETGKKAVKYRNARSENKGVKTRDGEAESGYLRTFDSMDTGPAKAPCLHALLMSEVHHGTTENRVPGLRGGRI